MKEIIIEITICILIAIISYFIGAFILLDMAWVMNVTSLDRTIYMVMVAMVIGMAWISKTL